MKNSTFELRWGYFFTGLVLGFIGFIILIFTNEDRRDKFYSILVGSLISVLINMLFFYYFKLPVPAR
jgi:hypothetical protein